MCCRAGDRKLNEDRIARVAFKFEFNSNRLIFVCDVSQLMKGQRNSPGCQVLKSTENRRVKQNRSVLSYYLFADKRNNFSLRQCINDLLRRR